ncbi:hypothetical protein GCM10009733_024240 [Nonomuraea maheshkhaliensis]|uniref:Uncharacterized protein n=1 Tax=Nonomuraea maheshkhaliensis TaxID=419590 RepID=A0ABP4QX99_9ACTN
MVPHQHGIPPGGLGLSGESDQVGRLCEITDDRDVDAVTHAPTQAPGTDSFWGPRSRTHRARHHGQSHRRMHHEDLRHRQDRPQVVGHHNTSLLTEMITDLEARLTEPAAGDLLAEHA